MMVSNRITTIPTQALFSDDIDLDTSAIVPHPPQEYDGLYNAQKHTVSIVELGRRLRKCARLGNTDQVHELMTKGAPFTTDWLGTSALHLAAMNDHLETCEVLLRAGISRDSRTKVERTPLHLAAYEGHARICELLLSNKAEVDPRDMLRMTPLHWAVEKQHDAVIELLLQHGADPTIISKFDKTPISIAVELNRLDLAQLLQLAARLLAQQAELANAEESRQNDVDTLAATQSLDLELQQVDVTNVDPIPSVQTECKREMEDPPVSESMEDNVIDESFRSNNEPENDESTILKSANNTITSPSQISTLQLLQEHGITMLPTDEGGLVNNAIESGRTLVLSEAGKLVLAEGKKSPEKNPMPIIKQQRKIVIPNANLKNRKVITLTHEQFMAITKGQGNKPMLKKVSAEAFKKAAENAGVKYTGAPASPLKSSTPVISYAGSKLKRVTVIPTTTTTKELNKSPMKVINPAAITGLVTGSNKPIITLKPNTVQKSSELETTRTQLSKALAQIEELKRLLKERENENRKLREQIEEMKAKEKISEMD